MKLRKMDTKKIEIFKNPFFKMKKMNKKGMEDSLFTWLIAFLIIFSFTIIYVLLMLWNFPEKKEAIIFEPPQDDELNSALFYYHSNNLLEKIIFIEGKSIKAIDAIKKSLDPYFEVKNNEGISFANKKFSRYYDQIGLQVINLAPQKLKEQMISIEGFNEADYNKIDIILELQKSEIIMELSILMEEFCSNSLLLLPYGVVNDDILKTGPKPRGDSDKGPSGTWPESDPNKGHHIEFVKDVSYKGANFQIKLRMPTSCLNNMNKKLY